MSDRAPRLCRLLPLLLWALLVAGAIQVVIHGRYRADLSAFLPRSPSALQQVLVQQISSGPASRLILIGIDGVDAHSRAQLSHQLATALRAESQFVTVANGEDTDEQRTRLFAFQHRYLLSPLVTPARFSVAGLHAAIADSLALIASPAGLLLRDLFQTDPTGETLQVIDQIDNGNPPRKIEGVWSSADGERALLIAQTRASGADTDAQAHAIASVRAAFALATAQTHGGEPPGKLRLSGPGVFSVEARDTIKGQAVRLSIISTALIAALLLCAYRSLPLLLFGLLPVASGALVGVAAVALGFGIVEGVTLGFGITLIGESVDYPIYFLVQSHGVTPRGPRTAAGLWPTIGLGALTSICGFASLLPSRFRGLAQLGLYSVVGLAVAAATTRWVLPRLVPRSLSSYDLTHLGNRLRRWLSRCHLPLPAALCTALACLLVLFLARARLWSHDLSALSPVPAAELQLDTQLRSQLGAPDAGNVVFISAPTEQQALAVAEDAGVQLDELVQAGVIGGYDSPAHLLPSQRTQLARLASLPNATQLQSRLQLATQELPVTVDTLAPFVHQVQTAKEGGTFTRASLQGTSVAVALDAMLWQQGTRWQALLPLQLPRAESGARRSDSGLARIRAALSAVAPGQLRVLNLRAESDALYEDYLGAALRLSLYGLAAIVLLLALTLRDAIRVARVLGPLLLAVLLVASGFALIGVPLTILHLIGMLLIVAVGSNYALFFDRSATDPDRSGQSRMLVSLLVANASTVLGFAVLAGSSVPVLSALGRTVAPGTLLALWLAALLAPRGLFEPSRER